MKGFINSPIFSDRYLINEYGEIYSIRSNKLISQRLDKYGYMRCNLYRDNKQVTITIHRLVALAFIENPLNLPEVNHIDGNKKNNHVNNLEWVTSRENQLHAFKIGLQKGNKGESNGTSKYKEEDAIKVCELLKQKYTNKEIVNSTGYSISFIEKIKYGECWTYITKEYGIIPKAKRATTIENTLAYN